MASEQGGPMPPHQRPWARQDRPGPRPRRLGLGAGVGVLRAGFSFVLRRPRLLALGAIPPLITSILTILVLIWVGFHAGDAATWATPFADAWQAGVRESFRALFAVILFAASVVVLVLVFSSLTLRIGGPIYDKISDAVEAESGGVLDQVDYPARVRILRRTGQEILIVVQSLAIGVGVFLIGLIPVAGSVAAGLLSAFIGAFMVSREVIGGPADRRGSPSLGERRRLLNREPMFVLGFGIPVYILMSIPVVSMVVFPAATAGGTILLRRILREPVP